MPQIRRRKFSFILLIIIICIPILPKRTLQNCPLFIEISFYLAECTIFIFCGRQVSAISGWAPLLPPIFTYSAYNYTTCIYLNLHYHLPLLPTSTLHYLLLEPTQSTPTLSTPTPTLSIPTISIPTLPIPTLPIPTLPIPTLPIPILPTPTLPTPTLPTPPTSTLPTKFRVRNLVSQSARAQTFFA